MALQRKSPKENQSLQNDRSSMASESDSEWFEEDSASDSDGSEGNSNEEQSAIHGDDELSLTALITASEPVSATVLRLEAVVCCRKTCFVGKRAEVTQLLATLDAMPKSEKQTAILTTLAMCAAFSQKDVKQRERFDYYIPFVGQVCKYAFESIFSISHRTLHLYRKRVQSGFISSKIHGNIDNKNASVLDVDELVKWYMDFASAVGDVVPVRVRLKQRSQGTTRRYFSYEDYTLIPPAFTWDRIREEYILYLDEHYVDTPRPSPSSFRRILQERCPTISIRSGRDQVCDVCSIYRTRMGAEPKASDAEIFGDHLSDAKAMRTEYKIDTERARKDNIVLVMDYAQNLTIPSVPDTPSSWYFLSLISISMFGIYCANDDTHKHFMYSERTGGKGPDEVTSMLHHMLDMLSVFGSSRKEPEAEPQHTGHATISESLSEPPSTQWPDSEPPPTQWPDSQPPPTQCQDSELPLAQLSESVFTQWHGSTGERPSNTLSLTPRPLSGQSQTPWSESDLSLAQRSVVSASATPSTSEQRQLRLTVWCDNCGGQNKNSHVIWYLLFLVEYGVFEEINLKFFMKGHTKNACDRGFGIVKQRMARASCWTMDSLVTAVENASSTSNAVNLDTVAQPFWAFKQYFSNYYKKLQGIQRHQLFRMVRDRPGQVECRRTPTSKGTWTTLRRSTQMFHSGSFSETMSSIPKLPIPPLNPEKVADIFKKILPFVPAEFANDPMYQKPTTQMEERARNIKKTRRQSSTAKRKRKDDEGKTAAV